MSTAPSPAPPAAAARRFAVPYQPYLLGFGRFARRLPAVVPVALFLAIAWLDFGAGVNIPAMFWHETAEGGWLVGLVNGASVTLLFFYVWLVTYVLDATFDPDSLPAGTATAGRPDGWTTRLAARLFPFGDRQPAPAAVRLRAYLTITFLPCVLLLALATAVRVVGRPPFLATHAAEPYATEPRPLIADRWAFLLGVATGLGVLLLLHRLSGRVFTRWERFVERYHLLARLARTEDRWVRAVVEGVFALQAAAYVLCAGLFWYQVWYPPAILAVCMFFGLLAGVSAAVWYHARRLAVPVFVLVGVLLYAGSGDPYKLRFPGLEYGTKVDLADLEAPAATWESLMTPDRQQAEWRRVKELTATRIRALAAGPAQKTLADRLDEVGKGEPGPVGYRNLLWVHTAALTRAEQEEQDALAVWAKARSPGQGRRPKLAVVTVTGGANRSALWTATVLAGLEREAGADGRPRLPGFPKHVRLIAGASGGMVGAGYYASSLTADGLPAGFAPTDMAQNHMSPIFDSLVFQEVPRLLVPFPYTRDRGHALDLSLEGNGPHPDEAVRGRLRGAFARPVRDLRAGEDAGWRPPLVFTPMMIEDGRRLFVSNRHLHYLTVSSGNMLLGDTPAGRPASDPEQPGGGGRGRRPAKQAWMAPPPDGRKPDDPLLRADKAGQDLLRAVAPDVSGRAFSSWSGTPDVYGRSGVELFHVFPAARDTFRLSTAARMNATFPVLSPAVNLPTVQSRRVVDAGFYDNYGVSVAAGWIARWREWLADNTSGVVVIQVRDSASQSARRNLAPEEDRDAHRAPAGRSSTLAWLTGPLAAVDKARQSTSSFRNDELLTALDGYFRDERPDDPQFFQTVVFERFSNVGMSWYLNAEDRAEIARSWTEDKVGGGQPNTNKTSLARLEAWWNAR